MVAARQMKTLIVDDEPVARQILRDHLELIADVTVVGEAADGREALRKIEDLAPDLVLLDLQMPVMGGFDLVRSLTGATLPVIVIVTAFQQYAIDAFDAGAVDYLLKPVSPVRLKKAVERARTLVGKPLETAEHIAKLGSLPGADGSAPARKLVGRIGREYFLLDPSEVLAFQAEGELVWIITSKRRYLATRTLVEIERDLAALAFQRVHRGAIVNLDHVRKMSALTSHRWLLTLSNQLELVVSKRQAHNMRRVLLR
jgi:two-component system, LytTR family, response regulator